MVRAYRPAFSCGPRLQPKPQPESQIKPEPDELDKATKAV